jgi:6-phosphogluconolactonase
MKANIFIKNSGITGLFILFFSYLVMITACHGKHAGTKSNLMDSGKINKDSVMYLYVGTYTKANNSSADSSAGIYVLSLNLTSGALSIVATSPATSNPSFLILHPNMQYLYAVNENGGKGPSDYGSASAFRIDNHSHHLQFLNSVSSTGKNPCYISLDPANGYAMVANYSSGNVALLPIASDGTLKEASSVIQDKGKGPNASRQEGPHAHMISPDPQGKFIYATDLGTDKVSCYSLDVQKQQLVNTGHVTSLTPGAGPRHIAFHQDHAWVYVVNELNGTIEAFYQDVSTGILRRFQIISTLPKGIKVSADCADIHISPSGKYLYASNRGENNTIALYSINETSGELNLIEHRSTKGMTPRNFAIDPTGTFLLVANQNSNNIVTFRIDSSTGKLIDINQELNIPMPVCIKFEAKLNR